MTYEQAIQHLKNNRKYFRLTEIAKSIGYNRINLHHVLKGDYPLPEKYHNALIKKMFEISLQDCL